MTILIIEADENNALLIKEALTNSIAAVNTVWFSTFEEAKEWLEKGILAQFGIFSVESNEGLVFDVFQDFKPPFPFVLMSAYDKYWSQAMTFGAIDYLRKPIQKDEILRVLNKLENLKNQILSIQYPRQNQSKNRIIGKKGTNFYILSIHDVAFIYTESRVVFLIDKSGERYIIEKNLSELEFELPSRFFFRVNRKFIVHINAIKSFRPSFKGKIAIELLHLSKAEVSISQENAAQFKAWIEQ
ncbi:MAG: LytTR family transcriptional regulator DNA-binding domain-containing protein [Spirosomaceae bacterium]|jgi:DNA-binding LytR/AlgR family response regulator|nr:LytTR family transcriptional regulator DNA-binding domain-containing protein [Spirosomataceae bacterium]